MTSTPSKRFHGYLDATVVGYRRPGVGNTPRISHVVTRDQKLLYTFHSHSHPYVAQLVRRLLESSLGGLQAADTEYETPVTLAGAVQATREDGTAISLPAGSELRLPDGARFRREDGTVARLAGFKVVSEPAGDPDDLGEITLTLQRGERVTLPKSTAARRPDGTLVSLLDNVDALLPDGKPRPVMYRELFESSPYQPAAAAPADATHGVFVEQPYPADELDFAAGGAYAVYNWEIFYHAPLLIAMHLSKNQRFEEAQRWFHYIFDPTDDSEQATPERFWKVKPFQYTDVKLIEEILVNLASGENEELRDSTVRSIEAWKDAPFRPHVVARYRQSAYMVKAIMAYLDNLIAWGDTLFRQDTGETLNEATQIYVLAANILGRRPQAVPKKGSIGPQTYASVRRNLDAFGNALVELETDILFDRCPPPREASDGGTLPTVTAHGRVLYFCVPPNDKLMGYWTTVEDRLFKLRNSLNIQGVFRQVPLFEPPIDPALLARAAAAGLDVGAIIGGLNQPLPLVRYQFLIQKAAEICQEVKSLGSSLLAAIEKEDNEALAVLRAKHERAILSLAEVVRYSQWQEAIKSREALEKSLASAVQRYTYYERLLGRKESEIQVPELDALDRQEMEKMRKALKTKEPEIASRRIAVDIAGGSTADVAKLLGGGKILSSHEAKELIFLELGQFSADLAAVLSSLSALGHTLPITKVHAQPVGVGVTVEYGGENIGSMAGALASAAQGIAGRLNFEGQRAARIGSYSRREQDWAFQSNLAGSEITQIFRQLRAAQIREAIAEREWSNHQKQIRNAEQIEHFLSGEATAIGDAKHTKASTQGLYTWMRREVKGLYGQCFQLAFDIARKAERALQHELGDPNLTFIQHGYLTGKEGLLAGEKLYFDIKRMEIAYHDQNRREYELTKHVSLLQVAPGELLRLRMTGRCELSLPEHLFEFDCPGHYFRRLKSVAVSIPCVTGPYTGVNCTLRLTKSQIRKSALVDDKYPRKENADDRFYDHYGSIQAIVTSSGQSDSGLFETNLHDERYLPFEGSGAISDWELELPADPSAEDPCQFDYQTIADVILHVRYTAREGGAQLRSAAMDDLKERIKGAEAAGAVRVFSMRHDFPVEWASFKAVPNPAGAKPYVQLSLDLRQEHFPFWSNGKKGTAKEIHLLFAKPNGNLKIADTDQPQPGAEDELKDVAFGVLRGGKLDKVSCPVLPTKFAAYFSDNSMEDLWLVFKISWDK